MALWMWLLHPSMSFLAIICCAASTSLVAVVLASPSLMAWMSAFTALMLITFNVNLGPLPVKGVGQRHWEPMPRTVVGNPCLDDEG